MTLQNPNSTNHVDETVPAKELQNRIVSLQHHLADLNIDAVLMLQNSDLFYFSGTTQQGHLYIPSEGPPLLMVRKSFARAEQESNLEKILPISSLSQVETLIKEHGYDLPQTLGMELDVLPFNMYQTYAKLFNPAHIADISHAVRMIRAIKSPYEIEHQQQAAQRADQLASFVKEELRPGITEVELAGRLEARARKLGHQGMVRMRSWGSEMFYGHLMAGPDAAVPSALASPTGGAATSPAFSQGAGFKTIEPHEPILFDYVFAYKGYLADHTRIFSLGELPEDLINAHQTMLDLQSMLKEKMVPGLPAGEAYDMSLAFVSQTPYLDYFMGAEHPRIRFVGHGIGLEVDEYPILAHGQQMTLKEGMVIALEPKLIFPDHGVVGIENTHLVTKDGLDPLTRYPDDIEMI